MTYFSHHREIHEDETTKELFRMKLSGEVVSPFDGGKNVKGTLEG